VEWVKPLYDPIYDPLWTVLEDLEIPVNAHGGTGSPDYGRYASVPMIMISEVGFYSQRPFVHMMLSGVFERFPRLKFVMTEMGAAWIPPLLTQLDAIIANVRKGEIGELKYTAENALARSATEYFNQNCWVAASQPGPADARAREIMAPDRFMWGSDYPHDEGTGPFTSEHLRQVFHDTDPTELKRILGENAAKLYDFDLDALAPLAEQVGPTVGEIAQPLRELPENPNSALLKGQGQRIA
jgi:predicted TIM-barrel fold metal-dependent hydrolase